MSKKYNILKALFYSSELIKKTYKTNKNLASALNVSTRFYYYFLKGQRKSFKTYSALEKLYNNIEFYYVLGYTKKSSVAFFFYDIYDNYETAKTHYFHLNVNENYIKLLSEKDFKPSLRLEFRRLNILLINDGVVIINFHSLRSFIEKKINDNKKRQLELRSKR